MEQTDPLEHHFFINGEGKVKWIPEMPDPRNYLDKFYLPHDGDFEKALQSAKDNAIEVDNQKDVLKAILKSMRIGVPVTDGYLNQQVERYVEPDKVYSLVCSVERRPDHIKGWTPENGYTKPYYTAHVTFDQQPKESPVVSGSSSGSEEQKQKEELLEDSRSQLGLWHEVERIVYRGEAFLFYPDVLDILMKSYNIKRKQ